MNSTFEFVDSNFVFIILLNGSLRQLRVKIGVIVEQITVNYCFESFYRLDCLSLTRAVRNTAGIPIPLPARL